MTIRKSLSLALMAAAGLALGTTTRPAHADDPTRTKIRAWREIRVDSESAAARGGFAVAS